MARIFDTGASGFADSFEGFVAQKRGVAEDVAADCATILRAVQNEGFTALAAFTEKFDHFTLMPDTARVSNAEIDEALARCPAPLVEALTLAAERIRRFHEKARPKDFSFVDEHHVMLGWRWTALDSVGIYVPGGRAAYPSTVLMNAIPARVAGVERVAMVTPAPWGVLNPVVLAAAKLAGVDEIWRVGGAQAIAALAYGAGPIRPVDKIVGPGNAFVAAAKRLVFGIVGIDAIAGPSEVVIVADRANRPEILAADLLAQAEHDPDAQSILICDDSDLLARVSECVREQIPQSGPGAAESWQRHGALILVQDLLIEAPSLVDALAPEHVQLACAEAESIARAIRHAGAIFIGRDSAEALGDYVTGSNHVLPTGRTARFSSGLSTMDFMKRTSIQSLGPRGMAALGPAAVTLAEAEGLPAHARSVRQRLFPPSADLSG